VSRLRSSLFVAIISLLVLTGYGFDLFGDCCSHPPQSQEEHGNSAPDHQTPGSDEGCQCICHQIATPVAIDPVRVAVAWLGGSDFIVAPNEIPPDAVPLGIEYPPQLA
jgi:hypothetical protein